MPNKPRLAPLARFIEDAQAFCADNPDTESRMKRIMILLEALIKDPTLEAYDVT
jgi:hypothetical protein